MTSWKRQRAQQEDRLRRANELLRVIAANGRGFFGHEGRVSQLELDARGRVWLLDKWTQKRVYTHYRYRWRWFTEGGTLRELVKALRDFVKRGELVNRHHFGPWPDWICNGDLWGYGESMATVREAAVRLGVVHTARRTDELRAMEE